MRNKTKESIAQDNGTRQGFYYIIPAQLMESGNFAKAAVYGLITSLANKDGFCRASNAFIANKINRKDVSRISNIIAELETEGWITTEVDKVNGNKRKIWLSIATPIRKKPNRSWEKTQDPYWEKTQESNISNSNIREYCAPDKAGAGLEGIEINKILEVFYKAGNKTINFGNKTQRAAAEFIISKIGKEQAVKAAEYATRIQGEKYAPTITTPCQLKDKLGQLITHAKKNKGGGIHNIS